jgi:hypothetical protein
MKEIYFYLFIGICIATLMWGMIRLERVYQYPFFMAAIFVSFILPQANSLVNEISSILSQSALEKVMLYTCLCTGMCWLGYQFYQPKEKWLSKLDFILDDRRLFQSGVILLSIGYACHFTLSKISIEKTVNGTWTGPATILLFFGGLIYTALPIFLVGALKRPSFINMTMVVVAAIPILQTIIIYGRRQPTMTFLLTIGMAFFLMKNYIPPRWFFIVCVVGAMFVIPLLGALRGDFWSLLFSGDWDKAVTTSQTHLDKLNKNDILELRNAALMIDGADIVNRYGYGTGFWDNIIFQYVPGQIVGQGLKRSLQFGTSVNLNQIYGYRIPLGTTSTGIGDSYAEFGYFGCLIFGLMGRIFKTLWISIFYRKSMVSALLYIGLISPAMVGVTHGIGRFLQEFIFQTGVIYLVAQFSKITTSTYRPYREFT